MAELSTERRFLAHSSDISRHDIVSVVKALSLHWSKQVCKSNNLSPAVAEDATRHNKTHSLFERKLPLSFHDSHSGILSLSRSLSLPPSLSFGPEELDSSGFIQSEQSNPKQHGSADKPSLLALATVPLMAASPLHCCRTSFLCHLMRRTIGESMQCETKSDRRDKQIRRWFAGERIYPRRVSTRFMLLRSFEIF